jgi:hypothetical protein
MPTPGISDEFPFPVPHHFDFDQKAFILKAKKSLEMH